MSLGEKLQYYSFLALLIGTGLLLASAILGFVGGKLTHKGYWETIKSLKSDVKTATQRKEPIWTPFKKVKSNYILPLDEPVTVKLQFYLECDDTTVPLMIRIAAHADGKYSNTLAGPSGVIEQIFIEKQTYYYSVSHPSIRAKIQVIGWRDPF